MKQTVNIKWASQPPQYIEPADEFPYFWVSAENDGLLDFIEIWDGNFWHKEKPDQLCCHSLNHGDMYLTDYIALMHEDYKKLLWLQTNCPLMPDETGVFNGPANEWRGGDGWE